jgi:hypothetical protein
MQKDEREKETTLPSTNFDLCCCWNFCLMVNEADLHDNSTFGTFSALHFTAFKIKHKKYGIDGLLYSLFYI